MIRQWKFAITYRRIMGIVLCLLFVFHISNFIVNIYYGNTESDEIIDKRDNHRQTKSVDSKENHQKKIMRNNNESYHGKKEINVTKQEENIKEDVSKEDFHKKLDILKMVPYSHSKTLASYGDHVTYEQKESRMQEIVESIRKTLIHPEVGKVYLFYQDALLMPYMEKQNLDHKEKIVFVPNMEDTMATMFRYANEHLEDHVVMVMNADTYPDEGFEKLDFARLRQKNLMYCLSRHGRKEKNCDHTKDGYSNKCSRTKFVGSMDAYLFSPKAAFKEEHYKAINYPPRHPGIENVICWVFADLRYKVLNPCEVLKIYHIHCGVRLKLGQRINLRHSHSAFPGNKLF